MTLKATICLLVLLSLTGCNKPVPVDEEIPEAQKIVESYLQAVSSLDAGKINDWLSKDYTLVDSDGKARLYGRENAIQMCGWEKGMNTKWSFEILRVEGSEVTVLAKEVNDYWSGLGLGFGLQLEKLSVDNGKIVKNVNILFTSKYGDQDVAFTGFKRWLLARGGIKETKLVRPDSTVIFDSASSPVMSRWLKEYGKTLRKSE